MRMGILRLSGLVLMVVTPALFACALRAGDQSNDDADAILRLHQELLDSHIRHDVAGVLAAESEQLVVVSRGEVHFPSRAERFNQFERYLCSVEFEEYRDLIDPMVRVSDDGTLGWLIAQARSPIPSLGTSRDRKLLRPMIVMRGLLDR